MPETSLEMKLNRLGIVLPNAGEPAANCTAAGFVMVATAAKRSISGGFPR